MRDRDDRPAGRRGKRAEMLVHSEQPYNAEPARRALAASGHLTAVDTFYSRNHGEVPALDPEAWRLRVDGLVDTALELSLAQLRGRFPERTIAATLQCAGNRREALTRVRAIPGEDPWSVGATSTAAWTGVSLADVLAAAGVQPGAGHVAFEGADLAEDATPTQAYASSVSLAKGLAGEVLLAWGMNGEDLPALHGGPVRVVVPGYIGARSVKWVQRVSLLAEPSESYFQATAYRLLPPEGEAAPGAGFSLGPVALNSDVLVPDDGDTVAAGAVDLRGYAFAGDDRAVTRVDVTTDGGRTWTQATLEDGAGPWTWQLWHATVELAAGRQQVLVRAWDSTGATQPESPASVWNPKGYCNNSWGGVELTVTGEPA